ncbi:13063_t:CDS:1, partial [Dentiscutata erythropus]
KRANIYPPSSPTIDTFLPLLYPLLPSLYLLYIPLPLLPSLLEVKEAKGYREGIERVKE